VREVMPMNHVPSNVHFVGLDVAEEGDMAAQDAIERLAEKIDDIRSGQVTFAVEQAKMSGKLEAMEAQLTALQRTLADVNTLRENVTRLQEQVASLKSKELRGWVESIVKAALGGGIVLGAQHFF